MRNAREIRIEHIIIGQECVCPDGLGRVVEVRNDFPHTGIKVDTYVNNRGCFWSTDNVKIVPMPPLLKITAEV